MNKRKIAISLTLLLACILTLSLVSESLYTSFNSFDNKIIESGTASSTNYVSETSSEKQKTTTLSSDVKETSDAKETSEQSKNIETAPYSNPEALKLYDSGLKLYYERKFYEALNLFNKALEIDQNCYQALNGKGATLAFLGKYDEGIALIKKAQTINPTFVYARFNEGLANELAGRWTESISAYHEALKLDKNDTWSWYGIATVYGRQGNVEKVLEYLRPAIELEKDVKAVAREEKDFAPVRHDKRFQELINP